MAKAYAALPLDCWDLILNRADNWDGISLVCKEFLSISNYVRHDLKMYSSSMDHLIRLLKRFRYLKRIDFSGFFGDINEALREIARYGLNLKSLNVSRDVRLKDSDLMFIVNSLPSLEEIDISRCVNLSEVGIERLARLPNLQKVNLSGIDVKPERHLLAMASNCPFLKEIKVSYTNEDCIGYLFRHCHNLVSLSISVAKFQMNSSQLNFFTFENSISYAKNLYEIGFYEQLLTDDILCAIAKARIPLKKLKLELCRGYSVCGLSICLNAHPSLQELSLEKHKSLEDKDMCELFKYLHNITYINLKSCKYLTSSTFFNLLKNCPSLIEIDMSCTNLGTKDEDLDTDLTKNYHVQNLRLSRNGTLKDYLLNQIGHSCPNLQLLDIRYCDDITSNGIRKVLKWCKKIKYLKVHTMIFRRYLRLLNSGMEVLEIAKVDDKDMKFIAERCCGLRKLTVNFSHALTNEGVMVVIEKCINLRQIKLRRCDQVNVDTLPLNVRPGMFHRVYLRRKTNFLKLHIFSLQHAC